MKSVYESYVAQEIKKIFLPKGWDVSCQDKGLYLFEEPRRQFALRPDIVMKKDKRTVILDTKWKSLINNDRQNYGISQSDMYQMYAYSKKYATSEIWLLYPMNREMREASPISFKSKSKPDGLIETNVNIYFITLDNIKNSLNGLMDRINQYVY